MLLLFNGFTNGFTLKDFHSRYSIYISACLIRKSSARRRSSFFQHQLKSQALLQQSVEAATRIQAAYRGLAFTQYSPYSQIIPFNFTIDLIKRVVEGLLHAS